MAKEKVTFSKWDIADYLKTEDDIREYLNVAAGSGDSKKIVRALGDSLRARDAHHGLSERGLRQLALRRQLSDENDPTLERVCEIVSTLGLRIQFVPAGND